MRISSRLLRLASALAVVFLLGGLLGATLVRLAPGFDSDERELDPRLGAESIASIRAERAREREIMPFYYRHLRGMVAGDLGESRTLGTPVSALLSGRIPVTARLTGFGLAAGWAAGLAAAILAGLVRVPGADGLSSAAAAVSTSIPVALLAFAVLYWNLPVWLCIAVAVFPRVFRFTGNAFAEQWRATHVTAALSRGVSRTRVILRHVAGPVFPRTVALAGVTVSVALGAAIPVEVLADVPGIGQLAWKAASGRDLPVLVSLTMVVTAVTLSANALADIAVERIEGGRP